MGGGGGLLTGVQRVLRLGGGSGLRGSAAHRGADGGGDLRLVLLGGSERAVGVQQRDGLAALQLPGLQELPPGLEHGGGGPEDAAALLVVGRGVVADELKVLTEGAPGPVFPACQLLPHALKAHGPLDDAKVPWGHCLRHCRLEEVGGVQLGELVQQGCQDHRRGVLWLHRWGVWHLKHCSGGGCNPPGGDGIFHLDSGHGGCCWARWGTALLRSSSSSRTSCRCCGCLLSTHVCLNLSALHSSCRSLSGQCASACVGGCPSWPRQQRPFSVTGARD
mmetsp:Transcript_38304/g.108305  ORF Transcript_38304/g.108305 Transcript_38304/m.108305 type:complete len:277 (+) Transcript_38304:208-1038(+)